MSSSWPRRPGRTIVCNHRVFLLFRNCFARAPKVAHVSFAFIPLPCLTDVTVLLFVGTFWEIISGFRRFPSDTTHADLQVFSITNIDSSQQLTLILRSDNVKD